MIWTLVLLVPLIGVAWAKANGKLSFGAKAAPNYLTQPVKRGPLEVTATERGSLDSASNVPLVNKVEGTTTIISIVPEGTSAEAGQVLVELDSSKLRDSATQQQILLEQADAALKQATENLEIQKTQNESDKAAAKLKLELAVLDLEKYEEGDYVQERNTINGEIQLAKQNYTRALEKMEFSKRLSKKGYVTQSELKADEIAVVQADIALKVAEEKRDVLEKYTKKRQLKEMGSNAEEFERELDRVKRKAEAALTQMQANLSAAKLTAAVERSKWEKLNAQIAACTIRAPSAGEVVYANNSSDRRGGGQEILIQEGAQVRERQTIINLPDFSKMQVNSRIHESRIGLIKEGLPALIRVDASPGEVYHGVVDNVSTVPLSGGWPNRDLKEYAAVIRLTEPVERMRQLKPGLTAEVDIQVDRIDSTLLVPVQAIVQVGTRHFAAVPAEEKPELREVAIGRTNDIQIEILEPQSKLKEGDEVILNPRSLMAKELEVIEREEKAKAEAEAKAKPPTAAPKLPAEKPAAPGGPGSPGSAAGQPTLAGGGRPGAGPPGAGGPGAGGPGGGPPGGVGFDPAAFFKRMDADGDGKLTLAEVPERMQERFATMDTNKDGMVDMAEFQSAPRPARPPGGGGPPAAGGGAQ